MTGLLAVSKKQGCITISLVHSFSFMVRRYATLWALPPVDSSQDITNAVASLENGVMTVNFTRPCNSGDSRDTSLDQCRFLLYAYGSSATIANRTIGYHGRNTRGVLLERFCLPCANNCPAPPTQPTPTPPTPTPPTPTPGIHYACTFYILLSRLLCLLYWKQYYKY